MSIHPPLSLERIKMVLFTSLFAFFLVFFFTSSVDPEEELVDASLHRSDDDSFSFFSSKIHGNVEGATTLDPRQFAGNSLNRVEIGRSTSRIKIAQDRCNQVKRRMKILQKPVKPNRTKQKPSNTQENLVRIE